MMLLFGVFILVVVAIVGRIAVSGITQYTKIKNNFSKEQVDFTEKKTASPGEVVEMVMKDGVWKISTDTKA